MMKLKTTLKAFFNLVYPHCCAACGNVLVHQEKDVCVTCLLTLPKTGFHASGFNPLNQLLKGRVEADDVVSYYFFDKGLRVQRLLHHIKYNGRRELAVQLGEWYGHELKEAGSYANVDCIVPVPLHPGRLAVRKYNQSEAFAEGLAAALGKRVESGLLQRTVDTSSQTRKSRIERWENVSDVFSCPCPDELKDCSVLLVDDVITTGATLEACARVLWKHHIRSLKIATIACAQKI